MEVADRYYFVSHASGDNDEIRDILLHLLDGGIRLWFDRPQDIGVSVEKFVAKIPVGDDWQESVDMAANEALGMLCFVTKSWVQSPNCIRELEIASHRQVATHGNYWIGKIFLNVEDHKIVLPVAGTLQAVELFDGVGSKRSRDNKTERLIGLKNELLIRQNTKEIKPKPKHQTDTSLLFSIDRNVQIQEARVCLQQSISTPRTPLLLYLGEDTQCLAEFRRISIMTKLLPRIKQGCLRPAATGEFIHKAAIAWDVEYATTNPNQAKHVYADDVLAAFGEARETNEDVVKKIVKVSKERQTLRILTTAVMLKAGAKVDLVKGLAPWFQFWEEFPFDDTAHAGQQSILPMLQITISEHKKRGFMQFFQPKPATHIATQLSKLTSSFENYQTIAPKVLSPLQNVSRECFLSWLDTDEVLEFQDGPSERHSFTSAGLALFDGRNNNISMRDWATLSQPLLIDHHVKLAAGTV
jgi:hypothetical protein